MGRRTMAQIAADDAKLIRDVAEMLVDMPTVDVCPLHGPECPVWRTL